MQFSYALFTALHKIAYFVETDVCLYTSFNANHGYFEKMLSKIHLRTTVKHYTAFPIVHDKMILKLHPYILYISFWFSWFMQTQCGSFWVRVKHELLELQINPLLAEEVDQLCPSGKHGLFKEAAHTAESCDLTVAH